MRVFVFDLLPYAEHLDHLKQGTELPWPLPKRHFKPDVAVRTYAEHLAAWAEMDQLRYLHPLRWTDELDMRDCISIDRLISGFASAIPRENTVYNVPLSDSRARFEEAWEIIRRAWTEEVFSFEGRFWTYHDVAIWP